MKNIGAVRTLRIVRKAFDVSVFKNKIRVRGSDVIVAPPDRWRMEIDAGITSASVKIVFQIECHQPAAAADIKDPVARLHLDKEL